MANIDGWKVSLALVGKYFGKAGDGLAEALASFDPETASELDRDRLEEKLREVATKLAQARRDFDREQKEADDLRSAIARDEKAALILIDKLASGAVDEATVAAFADELEAEKARLPQEEAEAAQAKEVVKTIGEILGVVESRLADFDRKSKEIRRQLAQAKADEERAKLQQERARELKNLAGGIGADSGALGALARQAEKARVAADAAAIMGEGARKEADRAGAVAAARAAAEGTGASAGESAADRLRRMLGK